MVLMCSHSWSSPSAIIFCGASASSNSFRVALLTPASVACAESTTATSSVYGLRCSSSPLGSGLALRKREKASWTSAEVQALVDAFFDALVDVLIAVFAAGACRNLAVIIVDLFGRGFAAALP